MSNHSGIIIVISGPSSVGKTKVIAKLIENDSRFRKVVSYTTRKQRVEERDGEDYHFVDVPTFLHLVKGAKFLQWKRSGFGYYGTPLDGIKTGQIFIVDADPDSYLVLKAMGYDTLGVYLLPDSLETLKSRIYSRGPERGIKTEHDAKLRYHSSVDSIKSSFAYDYLLVNDDEMASAQTIIHICDTELVKRNKDTLYKKWFTIVQNLHAEED